MSTGYSGMRMNDALRNACQEAGRKSAHSRRSETSGELRQVCTARARRVVQWPAGQRGAGVPIC